MRLTEYGKKRDFTRTPEPVPGAPQNGRSPLFVIQKHRASRLHYDLRLEAGGVLKSWAVPKGPSVDPRDSRLAMHVEDHPLEYAGFHGVIPAGNYGAGTVEVWDTGTYRPVHGGDAGTAVEEGIRKGSFSFILEGKRLRGEFLLARMRARGGDAWLLKKKEDAFASEDRAVVPPEIYARDLDGATEAPMPERVRPMLATLVERPFSRKGWLFEVKWDGYRAVARIRRGAADLWSRNGNDLAGRFPSIARSLARAGFEAVVDGEIAVVDSSGAARFRLLQEYLRTGAGDLVYYVFDLLWLNGYDLQGVALARRKFLLERLFTPALPGIRYSSHIEEDGTGLFALIRKEGIEGMMAKDGASRYEEGVRGYAWQKVKTGERQEAVIGGFTEPGGARKGFGSLLLGVYGRDGRLEYIGHSGGGFSEKELRSLYRELSARARKDSPFRDLCSARGVTWVRPEMVCEARFTEWTKEGLMRHPVFLGLRTDKVPREVTREAPRKGRYFPRPEKRGEEILVIGDRQVRVSNPGKVFWPDQGYTKKDLIGYYRAMAHVMLPFLVDRPESLHRYPDGIYGKDFFHKDVGDLVADWIPVYPVSGPGEEKVSYMLCQDEASLVYMVNLGCIEINPWNSRVRSPGHPDYMVFDFDPVDVPFKEVVKAALVTHRVLDRLECANFCKTSGSKGMHIYVPLGARYTHLQARYFAELVNRYVHSVLPDTTSLERMPRKRAKKVYLDYLQNAEGKTMAAPYSVRPREKATVSCPLEWDEVTAGLDPAGFTIETMPRRIKGRERIWAGVLGRGADLPAALGRLERLFPERDAR